MCKPQPLIPQQIIWDQVLKAFSSRQWTAWLPSSCRGREGCPPSCHPRSREEGALMRCLHDGIMVPACAGSTAFSATPSHCGNLPIHPPNCCHCAVPGSLNCQSPSCCSIWREEVCAGTACLLKGCGKLWLLKTPLSLKQHQLAC